ncbi:GGDEF domain-containing protein [Streptomyces sp. NBC_01764]|uniref:GGDEF domain-containing protein n=1 Tax=Streptomyces sp. NBC_01764 TaxID=2975935 RepID=UPI0022562E83|nr:GGDEF domain-containing protein [Streptomyces sp. NBC_01764]MCX4404444.1 GGDEF domain-containing protein [Streptomyces sp. NBC_01764]MCX4411524.1 GGDEF domain-containing protein [Streptomyces sp. NBC_01764]
MPAPGALRQPSRTLVIAATVPLALAALPADDVRVRRQLDAARKDPLTGLPGRDALTDRTERLARTHREQLHVLVADADGLKTVTDTLGYAAGDVLIVAIGQWLEQPVDHNGHILRPAVSIGTALAVDLPDAADASRLLHGADMAMYRVKTREESSGYTATRQDAYTSTVHGRRPGRPGTHLPVG